ncbi:MAG: hybrid sensor histidine kinase/response regulator [SAR324 cluster bacterium]|nr:hybrid sensor histidine kinase/response regulator [SAR324 cluster bacterium]
MSAHDQILIVDDQENNRLVVEDHLRKLRCNIHGASSGEEALEMLSAIEPDCILMDIMMPGMDGVETTRKIKSQKDFEEVPVLMITARDETSALQDAFDAGAVDYLVKPVDQTALLARVRSALRTRHAFQQVRDLNRDLLAQKQELSNFTHMVSHDLKSPVVGAASLFNFFLYRLRDDYPGILEDEGMKEMLQRIPDTFTKLLSFINTMLDYAEAGRVIGKQEMVSMDKVLRAVVQNFEYAEKEGMVYFEWEGDFPEVWCDPVRMVQVWQNLISNAIKYRGEKNPVQINLGGSLVENRWKFWVEDNGPGIPEDEHENIFQPFVRVDHDTEGSGIGLATTERILKAHGGQIQVEQKMTEGARFVFEIPKPN